MKKISLYILALTTVLVLAACGYDSDEEEEAQEAQEPPEQEEVEISDDEKVDEDEAVVSINDVELTGEAYNLIYVQTKSELAQVGQDIEDDSEMKNAAIDALVGQELLKQDAENQGIEIDEDEVESEFKTFKEENEEELTSLLDEYDLSENAFKDQLHFSLIYEQYLESDAPEMEISDDEVQEMYDELKGENEEMPELEDVEEQLKQGIRQEKIQAKIEELKEDAEVETLI